MVTRGSGHVVNTASLDGLLTIQNTGAYVASLVSPDNIAVGKRKAVQWSDALASVEKGGWVTIQP